MKSRAGVTLMELMVVLVILSVMAGVVALAIRSEPPVRPTDAATARVLAARDSAVRTGHPVTMIVSIAGNERAATAYPDGRVVADSGMQLDPLSGGPSDATR
ncbi:MAG: pilus assembly FimT family protein [Gemmatimonadaceae bacterium]